MRNFDDDASRVYEALIATFPQMRMSVFEWPKVDGVVAITWYDEPSVEQVDEVLKPISADYGVVYTPLHVPNGSKFALSWTAFDRMSIADVKFYLHDVAAARDVCISVIEMLLRLPVDDDRSRPHSHFYHQMIHRASQSISELQNEYVSTAIMLNWREQRERPELFKNFNPPKAFSENSNE